MDMWSRFRSRFAEDVLQKRHWVVEERSVGYNVSSSAGLFSSSLAGDDRSGPRSDSLSVLAFGLLSCSGTSCVEKISREIGASCTMRRLILYTLLASAKSFAMVNWHAILTANPLSYEIAVLHWCQNRLRRHCMKPADQVVNWKSEL